MEDYSINISVYFLSSNISNETAEISIFRIISSPPIDVIATPIGAEGTSVSFNVNRVIHLDEYMKENFSFVCPTK